MESAVQFKNASGKWLRGMVHLPAGASARRPVPGVVFFHGFTGDRMESHWIFIKCARALLRANIASLRFDFYGSGESDGDFNEVSLQDEISDARRAVGFLRRQKGIDAKRLGLLGLSLGGTIAAVVAPQERVRAMVLWAALAHPSHLRTLAEKTTKTIPGGDGAREYAGHEVSRRFLENLDLIDPLQSIDSFRGPTLIIHPGQDEYLPASHAEDYFNAVSAAEREKVIIPGADHTFTSVTWEREVIQRTVQWFGRHLRD